MSNLCHEDIPASSISLPRECKPHPSSTTLRHASNHTKVDSLAHTYSMASAHPSSPMWLQVCRGRPRPGSCGWRLTVPVALAVGCWHLAGLQ